MKTLAHDVSSSQSQFDQAVESIKILAATNNPVSSNVRGNPDEHPNRNPGLHSDDVHRSDLARETGEDAGEASLADILGVLESRNGESRDEACIGKTDLNAGKESEFGTRQGPSHVASSASPDDFSDKRGLPFLKVITGMITFAQIATGIILAVASATWFSVHSVDSGRGARLTPLSKPGASTEPSMHQKAGSVPTASRERDLTDNVGALIPTPVPAFVGGADIQRSTIPQQSDIGYGIVAKDSLPVSTPPGAVAPAVEPERASEVVAPQPQPSSSENASRRVAADSPTTLTANSRTASRHVPVPVIITDAAQTLRTRAILELQAKLATLQEARRQRDLQAPPASHP
jgi:hypothetical protein